MYMLLSALLIHIKVTSVRLRYIFSKLFYWCYYLYPLKAAFLCFVSNAIVTAFKVLYKESIETVDRPSIKPPTKKSDGNGF